MSKIDILLASFNGAPFLREQLESVLRQSCAEWRFIIRDDGSTDSTVQEIQLFAGQEPGTILLTDEDPLSRGVCGNFATLLEKSSADHVMFCDQDDVWLPNKISNTLAAMKSAEQQYGVDTPLLVHTDLRVVDEQLQAVAPSLWRYQKLFPQRGSQLSRLLPQNVVTGCTVMINRSLAKLALPIPEVAVMHDWWLALVAALFGQVVYLDEATILYRQHGNNSVGAQRWGLKRILQKAHNPRAIRESMLHTMRQAQAMLDRYHDQMSPDQRAMVEAYAHLPFMSKTERINTVFKYCFFRQGGTRTAAFLVNLLMLTRFTK